MEGSSGRAGVLGADGGFTRQQVQSTTAVVLHEAARQRGEYSEMVAELRLCWICSVDVLCLARRV